jgi:hypothetical protein
MPRPQRRAFWFESLEPRVLLAADLTFNVVFNDPLGLGAPFYSDITAHVQAAGAEWDAHLEGTASLEVMVEISDTILRATGRSLTSSFVGTHGAFNVFEQGVAAEIRTGIDPNAELPDIELVINPSYLADELWFDPDPSQRTAAVPIDRTDAMSVLLHELGHALAFNGFLDPATGAHTGPFESTFDQWTVFDGTGFFFHGPEAMALYGDPVPLTLTSYPHVGNELPLPGDDLILDLMNGVVFFRGDRYEISALDVAMVADTGLPINQAPVLVAVGDRRVTEGSTLSVVLEATDAETPVAELTFEATELPPGASFDPAARRFTWTPTEAQGPGIFSVTFSVTDGDFLDEETIQIVVDEVNGAPVLAPIGDKVVDAGRELVFVAVAFDPDAPANGLTFSLDPGAPAGTEIDALTGAFRWVPTHDQAPGLYPVTVRVTDDGTLALSDTETVTIRVNEVSLAVEVFEPTADGFRLVFNRPLDPSALNLYDTEAGGLGPADLTLIGDDTGAVRGSLVLGAGARTLTFLRTDGPLAPDVYRLVLRSAADAFRDHEGGLLDGNGDGVGGDNFVTGFPVFPTSLLLSVGHVARGPGQPVDVPATGAGLPVQLSDGLGVQSVLFTLVYDPALLTISAVAPGPALPAGSTVDADLDVPGVAQVLVTLPAPMGPGGVELVRLTAQVPATAPYNAAHVLDINSVLVNGGDILADGDDGLHLVTYLGDATGNRSYSALDGQRVLRVATGLDGGFAAFPTIDPVVVGDTTGNGMLSSLDASRVLQEVVGLDRPEIPPIPGGPGLIPSIPAAPSVPPVGSVTPGAPVAPLVPPSSALVAGLGPSPLRTSGVGALLDLNDRSDAPSAPAASALDARPVSSGDTALDPTPAVDAIVLAAPLPAPSSDWVKDFVS